MCSIGIMQSKFAQLSTYYIIITLQLVLFIYSFALLVPRIAPSLVAVVPPEVRFALGCSVFTLIGMSCILHKEHRFILPALPSLHILIGHIYERMDTINIFNNNSMATDGKHQKRQSIKYGRWFLMGTCVLHVLVAAYLGHLHQVRTPS